MRGLSWEYGRLMGVHVVAVMKVIRRAIASNHIRSTLGLFCVNNAGQTLENMANTRKANTNRPCTTARMWSQTGCQRSVLLQRAAPAKAATIAFPPRSLVRCAAHSHNLQPWQQAKLEEAYVQGKRKVKVVLCCTSLVEHPWLPSPSTHRVLQVNDLSKEIGLDRQVVLQWFKDQEALPER